MAFQAHDRLLFCAGQYVADIREILRRPGIWCTPHQAFKALLEIEEILNGDAPHVGDRRWKEFVS